MDQKLSITERTDNTHTTTKAYNASQIERNKQQ